MPVEPSAGAGEHSAARPSVGPERSRSFAELTATLERLNNLEAAIVDLVSRSRVPRAEVRRVLRCATAAEAGNAPAMQFMRQIFRQVGLTLQIVKVHPFTLAFEIPNSPYLDLLKPSAPRATCYLSAEAIARFFTRDLGLGCTAEEVSCQNSGDAICTFNAVLEQEDVREVILDRTDRLLLKGLHAGEALADLRLGLDLVESELDYRLELLSRFGLVTRAGRLTEAGNRHARAPLPADDEEIEPPWKELEQVTEAISYAASFAEALRETITNGGASEPVDPEVREEARQARSFAELLGRTSKKPQDEGRS